MSPQLCRFMDAGQLSPPNASSFDVQKPAQQRKRSPPISWAILHPQRPPRLGKGSRRPRVPQESATGIRTPIPLGTGLFRLGVISVDLTASWYVRFTLCLRRHPRHFCYHPGRARLVFFRGKSLGRKLCEVADPCTADTEGEKQKWQYAARRGCEVPSMPTAAINFCARSMRASRS